MAAGATRDAAIQPRDDLLHYPDTVTIFTMVCDFLKSRFLIAALLHHLGVDRSFGTTMTDRTHMIPLVFDRLHHGHMAELTGIGLVLHRMELQLFHLHWIEAEMRKIMQLPSAFGARTSIRLLDLVFKDQRIDPTQPRSQPTGELC